MSGPPESVRRARTKAPELGQERYAILAEVGRGAMGVVYRAYDSVLRREVALKCMRSPSITPEMASRMLREAQAMARLAHPNVVAVYDVERSEDGEEVVLAMEYVDGRNLREFLHGKDDWKLALRLLIGAGRGLEAAHRAGLLHRDFRPANVLVGSDGRARVTDFGLARSDPTAPVSAPAPESSGEESPSDSMHEELGSGLETLTRGSQVLGTPAYMAPEQHRLGSLLDPRADQFAYCVSLWVGLTGRLPFSMKGRSVHKLVRAKLRGPPPWPRELRVPPRVVEAIRRGLAPYPEDRWPSLGPLLDVLEREVTRRRGRRVAGMLAAGALVVAGGSWARWSDAQSRQCMGGPDELARVWDGDRRQRSQEAFEASPLVFADAVWARVDSDLAAYAERWLGEHAEACAATTLRGEQSEAVMELRMGCLRRARSSLDAAARLLEDPDDEIVRNAVQLVGALPEPSDCADIDSLEARGRPSDPRLAAQVERLGTRLDTVASLRAAGKFEPALQEAEALWDQVRTLHHAPVRVEAQLERGLVLEKAGRLGEARDVLAEAFELALASSMTREAIEAVIALTLVVGEELDAPGEAKWLAKTGLSLASRADDPRLLGMALTAAGGVAHELGEPVRAQSLLDRAVAAFHRANRSESYEMVQALTRLGILASDRGDYETAAAKHREAAELGERLLGPDHPDLLPLLNNVGVAYHRYEAYDEAEAFYLRAVQTRGDEPHPDVAKALYNLGIVYAARANYRQALPHFEEALNLNRRLYAEEHPEVVESIRSVALVRRHLGRATEAVSLLEKLAEQQRSSDASELELARTLENLGLMHLEEGNLERARSLLQESLSLKTARLGEHHLSLVPDVFNLAEIAARTGDAGMAVEHQSDGLDILRGHLKPEHPRIERALDDLARYRELLD